MTERSPDDLLSDDILISCVGWQILRKGATSYLKATAAFTYLSVTDRSLASGKKMFDYLTEEQTRLFPRAAFEAASEDSRLSESSDCEFFEADPVFENYP